MYLVKTNSGDKFLNSANEVKSINKNEIIGVYTLVEMDYDSLISTSDIRECIYSYLKKDNIKKYVQQFEEKTGYLVYHVIKDELPFGLCYSFLYVTSFEEEWKLEREDLKHNVPIAYVKNVSDDTCSEFGRIGIKSVIGGIIRTA